MGTILLILEGLVLLVLAIASLACFCIVVARMFKNNQTGLAIACIALTLCTGIGPLVAFVMGWMKSTEWQLKRTMMAWTGVIVARLFFGIVFGVTSMMVGTNASATFSTVGQSIGSFK
jgi:hypothetical protein